MRKADAARRRPIEHCGDHRAGLADKGDIACRRREMREARVEPDAGARSCPTQFGPIRRSRWGRAASSAALLQCAAAFAEFAKSGRDDDGGPRASRAEFGDEARHRIGRGRDHREVGRVRQARDVRDRPSCRSRFVMMRSTSSNSPSNPARRRLRATTAPTEPGRSLAPISATLCGRNNFSKLRIDISRVPDYRADAGSAPPGASIPIKQQSGESSQQLTIFSSRMAPNARGICRHCTSLKPDAAPDARSSRRNCRVAGTRTLLGYQDNYKRRWRPARRYSIEILQHIGAL